MWKLWFRLVRYLGWLFGMFGVVSALMSGWSIIDSLLKTRALAPGAWPVTAYFLFIVSIILVFCAIRTYQTIRKEKYANITSLYCESLSSVKEAQTFLLEARPGDDASAEEVRKHLDGAKTLVSQCLDSTADIFRVLTSTHCRACIKRTYKYNNKLYLYTYARDNASNAECRDMDEIRIQRNNDPLDQNKRFAELFDSENPSWHYVCNNLRGDKDFTTTSVEAYCPGNGTKVARSWYDSILNGWQLPYKSTLTCAVRQGRFNLMDSHAPVFLGFLSVDSESRGVFEERWDLKVLFGISDALYHPLYLIHAAEQRLAKLENQEAEGSAEKP